MKKSQLKIFKFLIRNIFNRFLVFLEICLSKKNVLKFGEKLGFLNHKVSVKLLNLEKLFFPCHSPTISKQEKHMMPNNIHA